MNAATIINEENYMVDVQWMIGGEAGYGIMTTGTMMAKIFTRLGLSVYDYVEYPSLIRGGHNAYYVRASTELITSQKQGIDMLVALNRESIKLHLNELRENAAVVYDPNFVKPTVDDFPVTVKLFPVPFQELIKKLGVDRLMVNTLSLGSSLALVSDDFAVLEKMMHDTFGRKGEEIVKENVDTSKAGFEYIQTNFGTSLFARIKPAKQKSLLLGGAEAIALGAIRAGVKFAAIYPMTPINGVMATLTQHALDYSIVVKEPEDEIAGINMAIGASYAGVRSMVATAGGGFSLMVEALGLAAQTEVPLVIVMGMRPGPATGMPTWTEQGDLRFVMHAAQGDFPRIVIAPGDNLEAFEMTMNAFNLADKYEMQVIVLVDKYLNEGHMTIDIDKIKSQNAKFKIERGKILTDEEAAAQTDYKRYLVTEDGISPRSLPGQKGGINLTGSDEHDEMGLYNEEAEVRVAMMDKRYRKLDKAKKELPGPVLLGDKDADLTVVSFGSNKMPITDAIRQLKKAGINVNFIHVAYVYPFPVESFISLVEKAKKTLVIELNMQGQFEGLIREATGITFENRFRKYDGRPFYPEEIIEKVKSLLSK